MIDVNHLLRANGDDGLCIMVMTASTSSLSSSLHGIALLYNKLRVFIHTNYNNPLNSTPHWKAWNSRPSQMSATRLGFLLNNFTISTWLLVGATLQCTLSYMLPRNVALLPAVVLLLSRLISGALVTKGFLRNSYLDGAIMGRWTASRLNEDGSVPQKPADKEIVLFVVGARSNQ